MEYLYISPPMLPIRIELKQMASSSQGGSPGTFHKSLIEASSLKVILLAGWMADTRALPAETAEHQTALRLLRLLFQSLLGSI